MNRFAAFAMAWALATGASAIAMPPAGRTSSRAPDARDRIICRRFVRIGSLVDTYRSCKRRSEWDREHANLLMNREAINSRMLRD